MSTVDNALFEGLFARALDASGEFARELAAAGYDRAAPKLKYEGRVLVSCLAIARRHVVPSLDEAAGLRELGRRFVGGFRETIFGRVATAAMPIVGPARFLPRLPGRLTGLRSDASVEVTVTGKAAQLVFTDPLPVGHFFGGVLEAALALAKVTPRVEVRPRVGGYVVDLSW